LLRAFARIARAEPDLDLLIAGPGQDGYKATMQHLAGELGIAERVIWPGLIADDLKWGALRAAEAFVLPSHQENFGIAVVESLAAGRPVLISNQVNIWPDIQEGKVGLVDDDSLEGAERMMRAWLALPEAERDAMSARAYPFYLARYSMKNGAKAINEIFEGGKQSSASSTKNHGGDRRSW
jgi:glycosyltransferase involved in cell wall biosynthesis